MTKSIEVRGLGKTYPGGIEAVRSIDFEVEAGISEVVRENVAAHARLALVRYGLLGDSTSLHAIWQLSDPT